MSIQPSGCDFGISPIIGVILVVALTILIVFIMSFIVFNLNGDIQNTPKVKITLSDDTITLIRSDDVDKVIVREGGVPDYELKVGDKYKIKGKYKLNIIGINNGEKH